MKIFFYTIFLLLSISSLAQKEVDSLENRFSMYVCACLEKTKPLTEETLIGCFQTIAIEKPELINRLIKIANIDTSFQAGYEAGQLLFDRISVTLINNCLAFYHLIDSARYSENSFSDKQVELAKIDSLTKLDKSNWNAGFYRERGLAYVRIGLFPNALKDFNSALGLDNSDLQSAYFKAWTLEHLGNADEAILLYTKLAELTNNNYFRVIAAAAKRKKNGL